MTVKGLAVKWISANRFAQNPPDPRHPNGIELDATGGAKRACLAIFPIFPAPQCGWWYVECGECGQSALITAAGRIDDPRSVKIACRKRGAR